jgi:hypothetical protein
MAFESPGIRGTVIGTVAAPAESKFDGNLHELRLAINHSKKDRDTGEYVQTGTTWLTYQANGEWGQKLTQFAKGSQVKITDALIETREFTRGDGSTGLGVTARFGEIEETAPAKGAESAW